MLHYVFFKNYRISMRRLIGSQEPYRWRGNKTFIKRQGYNTTLGVF